MTPIAFAVRLTPTEPAFTLSGLARLRTHVQNDGPGNVYLQPVNPGSRVTTTSAITAANDTYIDVTSAVGVRDGMRITSAAVQPNDSGASYGIVKQVIGSRVHLFNCKGASAAAGTAVTFDMSDTSTGVDDDPPGIRLSPGEDFLITGTAGYLPGKQGYTIRKDETDDSPVVRIYDEVN